jgi:4-amino-4-deoxy-L-arabinose transferase-like glycosyltransferase
VEILEARPRIIAEKRQAKIVHEPAATLFSCVVLSLSAIVLLFVAHTRPLSFDELLSWHTANIPTASELLHVQATAPVSLDPPLFHLLTHAISASGLESTLAIRLPSVAGTLLLLVTVWLFVRRMVGATAASLTLLCLVAAEHFYLTEARPYAIVLASAGLALLCWQNASRARDSGTGRSLALVGLAFAIFIASAVHYFGILLAVPFGIVEAIRWYRSKRVDFPVILSLALGLSAVLTWLPFLKAAKQYRSGYYTHVGLQDIFYAYTLPLHRALHISHIGYDAVLCAALLALIAGGLAYSWMRLKEPGASIDEWYLVGLVLLLPFFGVLLSTATSGSFESRYALEFTIGVSVAVASGLVSLSKSRSYRVLLLGAGCAAVAVGMTHTVQQESRGVGNMNRCLQSSIPNQPILLTNDEAFLQLDQQQRLNSAHSIPIVWIADMQKELDLKGTDNVDRTMLNLASWSHLPVVPYTELFQRYPHITTVDVPGGRPASWVPLQLAHDRHPIVRIVSTPACTISDVSQ